MPAYWIKFVSAPSGCVEAENEEAAKKFGEEATGSEAVNCNRLPYPADPRLNREEHRGMVCPSFCYQPERCKGNTRCPERRSCVD